MTASTDTDAPIPLPGEVLQDGPKFAGWLIATLKRVGNSEESIDLDDITENTRMSDLIGSLGVVSLAMELEEVLEIDTIPDETAGEMAEGSVHDLRMFVIRLTSE